jgi:hypothetical protein
MQTIIITRHYSGFTNVADTYQVGDHEADGNADVTAYDPADWLLGAGRACLRSCRVAVRSPAR